MHGIQRQKDPSAQSVTILSHLEKLLQKQQKLLQKQQFGTISPCIMLSWMSDGVVGVVCGVVGEVRPVFIPPFLFAAKKPRYYHVSLQWDLLLEHVSVNIFLVNKNKSLHISKQHWKYWFRTNSKKIKKRREESFYSSEMNSVTAFTIMPCSISSTSAAGIFTSSYSIVSLSYI